MHYGKISTSISVNKFKLNCHFAACLVSELSERVKMWKQHKLNVAHEARAECVTMFSSHFSVICDRSMPIYYRTDARQHGISLFYDWTETKKMFMRSSMRLSFKTSKSQSSYENNSTYHLWCLERSFFFITASNVFTSGLWNEDFTTKKSRPFKYIYCQKFRSLQATYGT